MDNIVAFTESNGNCDSDRAVARFIDSKLPKMYLQEKSCGRLKSIGYSSVEEVHRDIKKSGCEYPKKRKRKN